MRERLSSYDTDDSIAALATPPGESALAVVRTSGRDSVALTAKLFSRPEALLASPGGTVLHGRLLDPATGETADEVVLTVFRAPRGYTGEDAVEITCHGSLPGIREVLGLLERNGFRRALPGEFTFRAFFNGKLDLTRAEAVREVVAAKTRKAQALALHRLSGGVERRVNEAKNLVRDLLAAIEIRLDYPEDEVEDVPFEPDAAAKAKRLLAGLAATYREGKLYQEGVRIAVAGKTNAGKSSLFNLFLREDRSIVSEIHGTTRDYIEALVSVEGIPVRLYDTAGIRKTDDPVETEGVRRSRAILENSALVLYLVDAAAGLSEEDEQAVASLGAKCLPVWNKIDLVRPMDGTAGISTLTGEGFTELQAAIGERLLGGGERTEDSVVIDSERQKTLLERSVASLDAFERGLGEGLPLDMLALDLQTALGALGGITGEVTTEDVLETMFSRFCVGK